MLRSATRRAELVATSRRGRGLKQVLGWHRVVTA
jgi:hypothetical protein